MEFLTLQDVPQYHHRSAMSFRDRSPPRYHAKQHEATERMKVGSVVNRHNIPSPSLRSSSPAAHGPALFTPLGTPSPTNTSFSFQGERPSDAHLWKDAGSPQLLPSSKRKRSGDILSPRDEMHALPEASRKTLQVSRGYGEHEIPKLKEFGTPPEDSGRRLYSPLPSLSRIHDPWNTQLPKPEMLTGPDTRLQSNPRLPPFSEVWNPNTGPVMSLTYLPQLVKSADRPHEEPSPATMDHWHTNSARASRQNSTERPVFNDPFRGPPALTVPSRISTNNGASAENYTTQLEGRSSLLHARQPACYDSRKTSLRTDYEPRVPSDRLHSLPSLFSPPRTSPSLVGPITSTPPGYHTAGAYSPVHVGGSPQDIRRSTEAPYGHPTYYHEHYTHRPPVSAEYSRTQGRHDSTIAMMAEHHHHWPPLYAGYTVNYGYGTDHHNGMDAYNPSGRRRRGNLPKEATALLKKWFQDHAESPYPSDEEKNQLALATGLTSAQISNWFINARRRNPGKEAREQAKAMKVSGQSTQQPHGRSQLHDEEDRSRFQQQSSHLHQQPLPQRHEQQYPLAQIQASRSFPYKARDHGQGRDHEMSDA